MRILDMQAAYGRLRGDTLRLEPGLNVICAPNESGKSTWCSFLRTMLYGLPTRQSGPLADKNRYAPWTGEAMQGRMDLDAGGQLWTVLRGTRRVGAPMGDFSCTYTGTSQPVPDITGQNLGETLLGVPREVFQRSAFIGQSALAVTQDPELERRISSLLSTGQEDVSYSESYDRLKKQLNRRRHNKTGLIPALEQELLRMDDALRRQEPRVSPQAAAALYVPTSAIICPFGMTIALAENAAHNGVTFRFDTRVERIRRTQAGYTLETNRGTMETRAVISAAGVWGDVLHNQVCSDTARIVPRRGEYCLLDRKDGGLVQRTVFQLPGPMGKGVLVTPTVHGNLLVGPTAADQEQRDLTATTAEGLAFAQDMARKSVPGLPLRDVITSFAGLRAHLAEGDDDFRVGQPVPGYFEALGIESPGLSSAPAIGAYLAEQAAAYLNARQKPDFDPVRRDIVHLRELPFARRQRLAEENPAYGNIVCRCEGISEGEIVDAIHRVPGARSLDGVKRRVRAGMGRCQGGFCTPRVMEILARELGVPQTELTKNGGTSRLLTGRTKEEA